MLDFIRLAKTYLESIDKSYMEKTYTLKEILFNFLLNKEESEKLVIYCSEKDCFYYYVEIGRILLPSDVCVSCYEYLRDDFDRIIEVGDPGMFLYDKATKFYVDSKDCLKKL